MKLPSVDGAERLYSAVEVERAFDRMATAIDAHYAGAPCVALCLLQGAIVPAGILLPRLRTPVALDSVHVSRYRNATSGGAVEWLATPRTPLAGRDVLLIDDILDEGHSLAAVMAWCRAQDAGSIEVAVLANKLHERKHPRVRPRFVGLDVEDRYVFGYGMDYLGWHRNVAGIFAIDT